MSREQFTPIFETSYPTAGNPSAFVDAFFGHWLPEAQKDLMDFKARKEGRKSGDSATMRRRFAQPLIAFSFLPAAELSGLRELFFVSVLFVSFRFIICLMSVLQS